jgi:hypothetical protein
MRSIISCNCTEDDRTEQLHHHHMWSPSLMSTRDPALFLNTKGLRYCCFFFLLLLQHQLTPIDANCCKFQLPIQCVSLPLFLHSLLVLVVTPESESPAPSSPNPISSPFLSLAPLVNQFSETPTRTNTVIFSPILKQVQKYFFHQFSSESRQQAGRSLGSLIFIRTPTWQIDRITSHNHFIGD